MHLRFPRPLAAGATIGVTSPSSGVAEDLKPRLDVAVKKLEAHGYRVIVGDCMGGDGIVSAPAAQRAVEFQGMLLDPQIAAIIPPWGGETAIDLIPLIDWDALANAEPKWVIGYSDISTLITPLTLRSGWATIHGNNLMDTPYDTPTGLVDWLDIVAMPAGESFTQTSPNVYREGFVDYRKHPEASVFELGTKVPWRRIDDGAGDVAVSGRLIGGCIETLANLAGTEYLRTSRLRDAGDELLVYVEAAGDDAPTIARNLHGMRLNGFFDGAAAILVGRTHAPGIPGFTQADAVRDALGMLGVPIIAGVDCGHWAPYMPFVNGALATVELRGETGSVRQTLA